MNVTRCRRVVYERSGGLCEIALDGTCFNTATNISHRLAVAHGGLWIPSNCLHACGSGTTGCHGWVEQHPSVARDLGYRIPSWVPNDEILLKPALVRTAQWPRDWYLLADDGTLIPWL